jgi:hypothetical protein
MERGHPVRLSAQREQIGRASCEDRSGLRPLADKDVRDPLTCRAIIRIIQHTRLHGHLPLEADLCIDLAHSALPVILSAGRVDPEGVDINYGERAVALF